MRWMSSSCSRRRLPPTVAVARPGAGTDIAVAGWPFPVATAVLFRAMIFGAVLIGMARAEDSGRSIEHRDRSTQDSRSADDARRGAAAKPFYSAFEPMPGAAALTPLGRQLFAGPGLSASGKISSATL